MDVFEAIETRRYVRAFRPDPVPRETVERLLAAAAWAPSGSNIQPWKVRVVTGEAWRKLCETVSAWRDAHPGEEDPDYAYYPKTWREPYLGRRRKLGWALYGLLGIGRGDKEKAFRQHGRNFLFLGAPVGTTSTTDQDTDLGSWLDHGTFAQTLMLAARGEGLHSCAQGAWVYHHPRVRQALGIPDSEKIVCGMALGYADAGAPENGLLPEREPVSGFARFLD